MRLLIPLSGLLFASAVAVAAPQYQIPPTAGTLVVETGAVAPEALAGYFGAGLDGVRLPGQRQRKAQLQWTLGETPAGEYYLGLLVAGESYQGFSEFTYHQVHLYHNDRRLLWTSHTEPLRPEDAAEKRWYQAEMRIDRPVSLKPGDSLRVVWVPEGGAVVIGPLRLSATPPTGAVQALMPPNWGRPEDYWLTARWLDEQRQGEKLTQVCELHNPGALPRVVRLDVRAVDYEQRVLLQRNQTLTLQPGETLTPVYELKPGDSHRVRLTLEATSEGVYPPVRLCKYFASDTTTGPRPTLCLNGDWEMCYVPGSEPGAAPPADAPWQAIRVPSVQPNTPAHCAWYRRQFTVPEYLRGERLLLHFDQAMTEAWVYLNGKPVGHELHGSQPFEVDVTAALKPGVSNELLVAVRDWIAYSPRNQERVRAGEEPIYKDGMVDVAGYNAAANLGLGGPVYLTARPAVYVEDVFVVTSVRQRKLSLHYRLRNSGAKTQKVVLTPSVLDGGRPVRLFGPVELTIPAAQTVERLVEAAWTNPRYWWPEDPHLYILQTDLRPESGMADRHVVRFGFRELWIDGISFVLNGVRTKIRSQWAGGASGLSQANGLTDPGERLAAIWLWQRRNIDDLMVQLTRTHGQAGVSEAAEVADETGLMIKLESECNQVNFTFDQRFWNAVLAHELHVMDVYKNHPSVCMWSAGNENMWGWIYQGEAAKVLGNRWQVKIAQAMREFDHMGRPIEWEADGDLMGAWEHYALHYPRELTSFPDLPNGAWWGPLDGKTVVPYSMGPITLGTKPLTVGEAFWPATLNKPLGASIIAGDEPYASTNAYAKAWLDSSWFFLNGFRDAEFALIDTYVPMFMQPPQALVLKQEDRVFFCGQVLEREVNVHNDLRRSARLVLRWRLLPGVPPEVARSTSIYASNTGASVSTSVTVTMDESAGASQALTLAPAELRRIKLQVPLPVVREPTAVQWRVELLDGRRAVHTETRDWVITPRLSLRAPTGLALSVYDPEGRLASLLRLHRVPFEAMAELRAPEQGALVIGRDALKQPPEGPWREELLAFVRGGGKLVILEQTEAPDFLPVPVTMARQRNCTMAYARATDHPLLRSLTDWDLRWWAADHRVSAGNYRKPSQGNWLPLVDAGSGEGILESPLLEQYEGRGSIMLCQLLLTEKADSAPQAGTLLQNLLDYLATPGVYRQTGGTALFAAVNCPLRQALADSQVLFDDLTDRPDDLSPVVHRVAIVDVATALDDSLITPLRQFASGGGNVLLHRATPEKQALVEELLGCRVRLSPVTEEPSDIQNHVIRGPSAGLLAGVSNHDLYWASNAYYAILRHEGNWWSTYYGGCPPAEFIADYFCTVADADARKALRLTRPGVLLQAPVGQGTVVLSQLRLDEPVADCAATVARLRSLLLTNLGCTMRGAGGVARARQQRLQNYDFFTVDLSPYANRGLRDDPASGLVGWTNQGENDMRALPMGDQTLAGIPFHIASPRGAVVLKSVNAGNQDLPAQVNGIAIGRRADVLFFLHSVAWATEQPFRYRVNYEDGTSVDVPIVNGRQIIDWWQDPAVWADSLGRGGGFIAWQGDNPMRKGVVLPGYEWTNPHPEKVIRDLDFIANADEGYAAVPVLVAVTGAISRPRQGVVLDIVGTHAIKVQLGTQVEEVHYIGVAGIEPDDAYYEQALAAHRALVVGKRVTLVDDVVTHNAAGQRLAYVYLGDIYDVNSLVNARIIGDGLGKLGNFEGNSRQRMYLENLGFIAQQRKVGMWGGGAP